MGAKSCDLLQIATFGLFFVFDNCQNCINLKYVCVILCEFIMKRGTLILKNSNMYHLTERAMSNTNMTIAAPIEGAAIVYLLYIMLYIICMFMSYFPNSGRV